MSSSIESIYELYIKPLPREQQRLLLDVLRNQLENVDDNGHTHSILDLHGLGKEIWQDIDAEEYVRKLRGEWEERR